MLNKLDEKDWELLLRRIKDGKYTPFLGSDACSEMMPFNQITSELAKKYDYPMGDSYDFTRVAQFVAVTEEYAVTPKEEIRKKITEMLKEITPSYFDISDEIHGVLADLQLPVYITTNYDDLMVRTLESCGKTPIQETCGYKSLKKFKRRLSDFDPTPGKPLVYHLHGRYKEPESLVLTEDDYMDFLFAISMEVNLLPPHFQEAFTDISLLFLGYKITDWDFHVLFRILIGYLNRRRRKHVSVRFAANLPQN